MAKTYYKPKKKESKPTVEDKTKVFVETPPIVVEKELEEVSTTDNQIITLQISPLSPSTFCSQRNITGLNKDFLIKKYNTKTYTLEKWFEILIKENITN